MKSNFKLGGVFIVTCYDKYGNIEWQDRSKNLVVTVGLEHILDGLFSLDGESVNPNYYLGMIDASPTIVASDNLASHVGWNEFVDYNELTRQEFIESRTGLTVDNSASKAVFSINVNTTIGGTLICSVDTGNTGLLLAASAFSGGDKPVIVGNTVEVQYDFSASSS